MKMVSALLVATLALVGCRSVEISNGEVPNEYLSEAKKLEGTYTGTFNKVPGTLRVSFEGQKPVLTFNGQQGSDLLSSACQSEIGLLKRARIADGQLKTVIFAFNPNRCTSVEGRELVIDLKEKNGQVRMDLSLLKETSWERRCSFSGGNPANGIPPQEICSTEQVSKFYNGRFTR